MTGSRAPGLDPLPRRRAVGFVGLEADHFEFTQFRGVAIIRAPQDRLGRLAADLWTRDPRRVAGSDAAGY